jgi:hypothetical protein
MKKQAYPIIGALVLSTLFTISTANAQTANSRLVAKISFEFSVGNQAMQAGSYALSVVNPSSDLKVIEIRNLETNESAMIQMHPKNGKAVEGAKLVFNRYGRRYFLSEAWTPGDSIAMEASKSSAERAARKEVAGTPRQTETVALLRN